MVSTETANAGPHAGPPKGGDGRGSRRGGLIARFVVVAAGGVLLFSLGFCALNLAWPARAAAGAPVYGVDFSCRQAEWLGEDCHATYGAILDQLGVRHVRLSA